MKGGGEEDERVAFTSDGLADSLQSGGIFHAALLQDSLSFLLFFFSSFFSSLRGLREPEEALGCDSC